MVFTLRSKILSFCLCDSCLRADVSYFLCCTRKRDDFSFSACNKGNRRRLHAGNCDRELDMSVTFDLTSLVHTAANLIPTSILEWSAGNGETRQVSHVDDIVVVCKNRGL